jgi:hypothetical protein
MVTVFTSVAWQRLLSLRIRRPPSLLAILHCRRQTPLNCPLSDFRLISTLDSVTLLGNGFNGGRSPSFGLTSFRLATISRQTRTLTADCRLSTASTCPLKIVLTGERAPFIKPRQGPNRKRRLPQFLNCCMTSLSARTAQKTARTQQKTPPHCCLRAAA